MARLATIIVSASLLAVFLTLFLTYVLEGMGINSGSYRYLVVGVSVYVSVFIVFRMFRNR